MGEHSIQTLITTVNNDNIYNLLDSMNIQTSFLVGNQCQIDSSETIKYKDYEGLVFNRCNRGVGKNRNVLIENAKADICLLADDDMFFYDNVKDKILFAFNKYPDADVIIFNLDDSTNNSRVNKKKAKVYFANYMNYGAARIAFRRKSISYYGIMFNDNFGGGTQHQCGEDSLFIHDCLKSGLKIVAVPITLAKLLDNRESTWFKGYTDKYLFDKGVFLAIAHPKLAWLFALYLTIRHSEYIGQHKNRCGVLKEINNGIKFVKSRAYITNN